MNTEIAPLNNVNVRRALIAAVDRDAVRQLYGGTLDGPLQTQYLPPGIPGFSLAGGLSGPSLDFMEHPSGDLTLARSYLVKAGYPNGRLDATFNFPIESDPIAQRVAEVIRTDLAPLGITVHPEIVTASEDNHQCDTPKIEPALCLTGFEADFGDGEAMLQPDFYGPSIASSNNEDTSLLNDPVVNEAISKADTLPTGLDRNKAWAFVDDLISADAPGIPDAFGVNYLPESRDVHGVVTAELGWDLSYSWVN
jgi:peptide/nickel transport system substrate-binding protein